MTDSHEQFGNLSPEQRLLLLKRLKQQKQQAAGNQASTIARQSRDGNEFPLSFEQQGIWFLEQFEKNSLDYNVATAFAIMGPLDVSAFESSINDLVARHEILRTTFKVADDRPVQVVSPAQTIPLKVIDATHLTADEGSATVRRLAEEEDKLPFDLAQGPLIRVSLVRLGAESHVLLLTMHHIVFDGWSKSIIYRELSQLYRARVCNTAAPLPELEIQYADFSSWQTEFLQSETCARQLEYWKQRLRGAPSETGLPTDRPRANLGRLHARSEPFGIDPESTTRIKALAGRAGVTTFSVLLAVYALLLSRYSGHQDIVVGVPIANRNRKQLEQLIGMFINTVAVRVDLSGGINFLQLAERTGRALQEAFDNSDIPFQKLVEEIHPERNSAYMPIFQVTFNLLSAPAEDLALEGLTVNHLKLRNVAAGNIYDLSFTMEERGSMIEGVPEYNANLFDPASIARMAGNFKTLLAGCLEEPESPIETIPVLTAEEKNLVLAEWNGTRVDFDYDRGLPESIAAQAGARPDAVAVEHEGETLSYRQLNQRANRLAHYLQARGVGPEVMVGVYMERSAQMIVGLLAILKAGGAYVPLDLENPRSRIAFMLEDTGVPVLLSTSKLVEQLPEFTGELVCLDSDWARIENESADDPLPGTTAENLAYVIYTSGSTGTPKGVEIQLGGLMNLVNWHTRAYDVGPADRATHLAGLGFDASVWELWPYLVNGARLHLVSDERRLDPAGLWSWMSEQGITLSFLPTPLAEAALREPIPAGLALRALLTGGDRLHGGLLTSPPPFRVVNHYGPTENSVVTTWTEIDACSPQDPPIGRPIDNVQAYILDQRLQPVPVGAWGELYIGGKSLARGYLNQPQMTAEKFIPDPFADEPDARLYRSGDLVRYRADGQIEFQGRIDHQVKIRGFRVDLGEIESVLRTHRLVSDAVVTVHDEAPGDRLLLAYVVAAGGTAPPPAELREFVADSLPRYMLPTAFVALDELPLTANGKIDRKALPVPAEIRTGPDGEYTAPRTGLEQQLAGIWSEVLRLERVGVGDNFFDLGGHSLMATQVMSRIRGQLNVELTLSEIFGSPTLAELAPVIESLRRDRAAGDSEVIPVVDRARDLPLSFAQERLWFLDQLEPGNAFYNMPLVVRLRGDLSVSALSRSLDLVIARHETLRTRFLSQNGNPVQLIDSAPEFSLLREDLGELPSDKRDEALRQLIRQEAGRPFDLERDLPVRARLIRVSERDHLLLFTMHHIISDGWSLGVLFGELGSCYAAFNAGREPLLPRLPIQYADFASWQRAWLSGAALELQLDYWRRQLDQLPLLELPTDRPRPPLQTYNGAIVRNHLSKDFEAQLERFSQQRGVSLFMTLLAGFAGLLHRYTGQQDIVVGSPIANRNRSELEGLIGFFVNSLVMRTDVAGNPSFSELLERVSRSVLGAFDHQDLPFEKLVDELQPQRDLSRNPLFQVMFALQNASREKLQLEGLTLEVGSDEILTTRFDLEVHIWQRPDAFSINIIYNSDLFDAATIERLSSHYRRLLEAMLADPETRIADAPMLDEQERRQLVDGWNRTASDYPRDKTVHRLFEEQAAASPDRIALEYGEQTLSYGELNDCANRLAHYLQSRGVGPEVIVGISIERGLELVIGLLGILKAGGAYLPLDPDYPKSRLAFMLEDARVDKVLTMSSQQEQIPEFSGDIICLDTDWAVIEKESAENPDSGAAAHSLIYVIYTSGSTGRPKGTLIEHRSAVRLVRDTNFVELGSQEVFLQFAPVAFDASTFELWGCLLNGARLVIFPAGRSSLEELGRVIESRGVTTLWLTSALFSQMVDSHLDSLSGVRQLLAGGEALSLPHVKKMLSRLGDRRLINGYGPTENTTFTCCHVMTRDSHLEQSVPIGRPISNTTVYILDQRMQPVPVGVAGQLYIGGDGLARGYLNQPEMTAEKFVANPFSSDPRSRLYATGDQVRYRPDGAIEFIGRIDHQVKVRGYRIELGEIESALVEHAAVDEAVAIVREDEPGDKRIAAYVVPGTAWAEEVSSSGSVEHVDEWKALYEETYGKVEESLDPTRNFTGWNSSYTGEPIPLVEMQEWLDATVSRIAALEPRRVLEIGCGTGLLLFRLAAACERYLGTDFSAVAQQQVRALIANRDEYRHVELRQRLADDFSDIEDRDYDTVIINSVAQYLPSMEYLVRVIEASTEAIADGGRIMLGDIRSLPLLQTYHTSVQLYLSPDDASGSELLRNIRQHVEEENELVIEPAFFHELARRIPRLSHVEILHKRGQYHNELTGYRYDVLLHVEARAEPLPADGQWLDWGVTKLNQSRLGELLNQGDRAWIGIRAIPNARVARDVAVLELLEQEGGALTVGELKQAARCAVESAVDPGDLWNLAEAAGFQLELSYTGAGTDGRMDALLRRERREDIAGFVFWPQYQEVPQRPWSAYGSNPLKGRLSNELIPLLRRHLQQALPEYMFPSVYVVMDALPLNPNGKVERKALPVPGDLRASLGAEYTAPRTELEQCLADIWAQVLKLERVGVHDNFFDLGGHSLMATQVVSRIRAKLGAELPLSEMFGYPTVAELAPEVQSLLDDHGQADAGVIPVAGRGRDLPLSFAQERLWFLDQLEPGGSAYNMPLALRLEGKLNLAALQLSIDTIVERQQSLRTRFTLRQGKPSQLIDDFRIELQQEDLSILPAATLDSEVRKRINDEPTKPFDLNTGPLLRCRLLRLSDHEHVLLITMHHVISDGWSTGILFRELGACYEAFSRGEQPALAELPIQYADFALWQREWLSGDLLASQAAYWRNKLECLTTLDLPTDRPRPAIQTYKGSVEKISFSAELSRQLAALSRQAGVTLFMTMLAGFAALMHRYSGQDDIVVGTPIANRNRAELEDLIGFFVNSLVMRTDVSGNPDFYELVERTNRTALEAYEHQDLPFEKLVDELRPERDLSHNPLFQVMFALQNAPIDSLALEGLKLEPISQEIKVSGFDLECHVWERGDHLDIVFLYNTDLFDLATVRRMMKHYRRLLESATAAPKTPVGRLELLDREERQLMLEQWNQTRAEFVENETLHSLFARQAELTPRATAVRFEQQSLSYEELDRQANQLACLLLDRKVAPGQFVGLLLERSIDLVVAILGVLKAGAAYVPLDPGYPEAHLEFVVADANIRLLLSQHKFEQRLPSGAADVVFVDGDRIHANSRASALPAVATDDLAYVIYTSGSTGKPKGVMVSHAAVVNHACWMQDLFRLGQDDRLLQKSPISFDASVCEIFVPLLNGACVVLAVPGGDRDIGYLIREIKNNEITVLILVPSALRILLQNLDDPEALATLTHMGCGGEALTRELVQAYYDKCSAPLYNLYGPTETTIDATSFICARDFDRDSIPIGHPVSNKQAYILDRLLQPVPIGVHGELHIGGAGLARGYLNRPELTAEKFIADPFSDDPEARLYKTGDLARYRADGNIEYIGRIDHQVKLRGFRIEPGEIEAVLASHAGVREAAVMMREDRPGDKRLVGYAVVGAEGHRAPSATDLREFVRQKLPDYMVPSQLVILDRLPLNASGKLDRRALPMPDGERQSNQAFVEPRSGLERQLVEVWREVLAIEQVGIHDNFFDLGGHSLKLMELHGRLGELVEAPPPLVDLFALPTVSSLAERLAGAGAPDGAGSGESGRADTVAAGSQRLKKLRARRQRNLAGRG